MADDMRDWLDANTAEGQEWFTVREIWELAILRVKSSMGRRTVYDICHQYAALLGFVPERRVKGNFAQHIFNREQTADILQGVVNQKFEGRSYADTFVEMRSARSGEVASSSQDTSSSVGPISSGGPTDPALLQLLTELRGEVAQLRAEVAELRQVGTQSTDVNGVSLVEMRRLLAQLSWRSSVATVNLLHLDGVEKVEKVMEYVGVPALDDEAVRMADLEVDEVFEKIAKEAEEKAKQVEGEG